jgi:hypothetical protein
MHVACRVAVATVCALAMLSVASAQQSTSKPGEGPPEPPAAWSAQDIDAARARCRELLKGLDLVVIPQAPMREGTECGTPAPVQLVSIGSNPQISFSPPPLLTCEMVAALHRWLQHEVQPLARKHLGSPIVRVATMSSFSCRIARATGRLSEHGRINALDLGAFLTAEGETTLVLADWGPIAREAAAKDIAAKADVGKKKERQVAKPEAKPPRRMPPTIANPVPGITTEFPSVIVGEPPSGVTSAFGWAPPSRVGGPKPADSTSSEAADGKALFLRAAHRAACSIFATVLGPEANKAHKNHFHLDMAQRKNGNFCE